MRSPEYIGRHELMSDLQDQLAIVNGRSALVTGVQGMLQRSIDAAQIVRDGYHNAVGLPFLKLIVNQHHYASTTQIRGASHALRLSLLSLVSLG